MNKKQKTITLISAIAAVTVILAAVLVWLLVFRTTFAFADNMPEKVTVNKKFVLDHYLDNPNEEYLTVKAEYEKNGRTEEYLVTDSTFTPTNLGKVKLTAMVEGTQKEVETTINVIDAAPSVTEISDIYYFHHETMVFDDLLDYIHCESLSDVKVTLNKYERRDQMVRLEEGATEFTFDELGEYLFFGTLTNEGGSIPLKVTINATLDLTENEKDDLTNTVVRTNYGTLDYSKEIHSKNSDWSWVLKADPTKTYAASFENGDYKNGKRLNADYWWNRFEIDFDTEVDPAKMYYTIDYKLNKNVGQIRFEYLDTSGQVFGLKDFHYTGDEWQSFSTESIFEGNIATRMRITIFHPADTDENFTTYDPEDVVAWIDNCHLHERTEEQLAAMKNEDKDFTNNVKKLEGGGNIQTTTEHAKGSAYGQQLKAGWWCTEDSDVFYRNLFHIDLGKTIDLSTSYFTMDVKLAKDAGQFRYDLKEENKKTDSDGTEYYEITNFAELFGLSTVANCDKTIRLAKDIVLNADSAFNTSNGKVNGVANGLVKQWTPINDFKGSFDGQGHTISGVYVSGGQNQGFFAIVTNGTIKDMRLKNSYIRSTSWVTGSIAGKFSGTLENVYSDATVVAGNSYAGGLVGMVNSLTGGSNSISNCWFDGTLQASNRYAGGIAGSTTNDAGGTSLTMTNCLVTGTLSSSYRNSDSDTKTWLGGLLGGIITNGDNVIISDSLFAGVLNPTLVKSDGTSKFSYRNVGYMLGHIENSGKVKLSNTYSTAKVSWTENLQSWAGASSGYTKVVGIGMVWGVDSANITGTATTLATDANTFTGINAVANTNLDFGTASDSVVPTWIVRKGTYPILGCFADMATEEFISLDWYYDAEGTLEKPYIIDSASDLYGFNAIANDLKEAFGGKYIQLGADIVLNEGNAAEWGTKAPENMWKPIESFYGTFDGQGHTISGVYVSGGSHQQGFFSRVPAGTIKNLRMKNSYVTSSGYGIGSIAGRLGGTLENVYSDAIVDAKGTYAGGLVGIVQPVNGGSNSFISNCWFDGTLQTTNKYAGGIAGATDPGTTTSSNFDMSHCLVTGELKTSYYEDDNRTAYLGGLLGSIESDYDTVTISDSLFTGVIRDISANPKGYRFVGDMIGYITKGQVTLTNTYGSPTIYWPNTTTSWGNNGASYAGPIGGGIDGIGNYKVDKSNITGATTIQTRDYFVGENAKDNMNLNFTTYWKTVQNRTPVLKNFEDLVEESDITVMSYNIRSGFQWADLEGLAFDRLWRTRQNYVISGIKASKPTIIGLQEFSSNNASTLDTKLKEEGYVSISNKDDLPNQIYYKSELYTELGEGYFELIASPADEQRYCVYVILQDKATQNKFLVANTHWTVDNNTEKAECSTTIINKLPGIMEQYGVTSVMLMGDFNGTTGNESVGDLVSKLDLLDCKNQTINTVNVNTNNGWGTPVNPIDHIFISDTGLFNVKYYNVDNTMYGNNKDKYASDHYPVIVGLDF